jgi:acyl carrier protein
MADTTVEEIVAAVLEVPVSEVAGHTGPATQGRWTSLRHLQIVSEVQRAFSISLTPRQIRSVRTVDDLRSLLAGAAR